MYLDVIMSNKNFPIKSNSLPSSVLFKKRKGNPAQPSTPVEPILNEEEKRYSLFPIEHEDIWKMYKKAEASFWTFEEIDLSGDKMDWPKLTQNEQFFIKKVLSFFAVSDGIVNENLLENFAHEVQYQEARCFYGFQITIENIHAETYSQLIESFVSNKQEKLKLFDAIESDPCIKKKAEWCFKYTNPDNASFAKRLVAFAACEGIFFSGSFCAVFWLKKRGLMPGLCFSNELISRDEGLHCDFACLLYNDKLKNKLSKAVVQTIIKEAVDIECEFIDSSLPVNLIGMNSITMKQYIQFVADRLLVALQCDKIYQTSNPFPWMELISLQGKTNFFEKRVGEYSKAGVGVDPEEMQFDLDIDF